VLASYSDRSAALVVTSCGAGQLAILNADLNASSLPGSPAFVPIIGELSNRLIGQRTLSDAVASGEALSVYLPINVGAVQGLKIAPTDGTADAECGALVEEDGFVAWRWGTVGAPGTFEVKRDKQVVFAVASAAPAAESDLQTIDPSVLKDRMSGGRKLAFAGAGLSDAQENKDDAWTWAIVVCAACMIVELAMLRLFRT